MQQRWLTAYIDETGNFDLEIEKSGASNLFVCVAIVVDEVQSNLVEARMLEISRDNFSGAEVKSSGICGTHKRRITVLEKLADLSFGYYALVINKAEIQRDSGLQYKEPFYKFLNQMLYRRLLNSGTSLHLVADAIGGRKFMDSFLPYLKSRLEPDLFNHWRWDHRFVSSKESPQVQLADLIAGTLAWCFDPEKKCEHSNTFWELLKPKKIDIECWPVQYQQIPALDADAGEEQWDEHIYACSTNRATKFIQEFSEHDKEEPRMQVAVLRHLLFERLYESSNEPSNKVSDELIRHLKRQGFQDLTRQQFSSKVIGPLRDQGILISGGSDGYRLACSAADVRRYLIHDMSIIRPMLARLKKARTGLLRDTSSRYDALASDDFSFLRALVEAVSDHDITEALAQNSELDAELDSEDLTTSTTENQ